MVNQFEYDSFLKNALSLQGSVTPKVLPKVVVLVLYSMLISCLSHVYPVIALPVGPFEYGGVIMGLILVFRVNSGYDRWWEARKLWGNIVNQCRNLAMIMIYYTRDDANLWRQQAIHTLIAWPYLIKNKLRQQNNLDEVLPWLDAPMVKLLQDAHNKPNVLSASIAKLLNIAHQQGTMDSFSFLRAEEQRDLIIQSQGGCERILNTPIPFVMAVKSRRFILIFLLILPFALVDVSIYINPLITGIVGYAIFSLDQIGVELQNPFSEQHLSHLPLTEVCRTIEDDLCALLSQASD